MSERAFDCIVLDFDGTFTDVEAEAAPFLDRFRGAIADLVGRDVTASWEAAQARIAAEPGVHGWENGGRIVAPASADPYVRCTTTAQLLFAELGLLRDLTTRAAVSEAIFQLSYRETRTAFRPEARAVLEALLGADVPLFVVTNARTDSVRRKLAELAPAGLERLDLRGDARKFALCDPATPDDRFAAIPDTRSVDGLPRPVYPRRGRYFEALADIWARTGATPARTFVCGDVYELDLALPAELGASVHLVDSARTSDYERGAVAALGARGSVGGLEQAVARVLGG